MLHLVIIMAGVMGVLPIDGYLVRKSRFLPPHVTTVTAHVHAPEFR